MPSPIHLWDDACAIVLAAGPMGTGFFVAKPAPLEIYLCTCKHVIAATDGERQAAEHMELVVSSSVNGQLTQVQRQVALKSADGTPLWREHPDPDVDVFALRLSAEFFVDVQVQPVPVDLVSTAQQLVNLDVGPGDQVVVLGYPGARVQYPSARPVYREGIVGTPPTGRLRIRKPDGYKVVPAFWVDGMMVPGNSGGPVILRPERIAANDQFQVTISTVPPYVIGIVSGCDYALVGEVPLHDQPEAAEAAEAEQKKVYAGLALVMNAPTIRETLALF